MKKKFDDSEEWKNKYLRALADYQNLAKRATEEKAEIRKYAAEVVITKLLSVADTLAKAREHLADPGLDLAVKEFETTLAEFGVKKIDVAGHEFNPHEMECIDVTNGPENEVTEELLPGYKLHDKVIRVAQVKVGKQKEVQHG